MADGPSITDTSRFDIFGRDTDGSVVFCFGWVGLAEQGVRRAMEEAERFGYPLVEYWAEPMVRLPLTQYYDKEKYIITAKADGLPI